MHKKIKVVLLGAGSFVFGSTISSDLLTYPEMKDITISLVDIDKRKLQTSAKILKQKIQNHHLNNYVEVTTNRREALKNADYVVTSIRSGGMEATNLDLEIPAKYGIEQGVGDTVGPGGVFYGLRNASTLLDIAHDMEEISPDALLINYTNPMAIVSWAVNKFSKIKYIGLCDSVPETARELAEFANVPFSEVTYVAAGINHMAWFIELEWNGKDLYPILETKLKDPKVYRNHSSFAYKEPVKVEIFKATGYFQAENGNHLSEYLPYFRKTPDLIAKYRLLDHNGRMAFMNSRQKREERMERGKRNGRDTKIERSNEPASKIIYAIEMDSPIKVYGNVINTNLIPNLRYGSAVEVPVLVDGSGLHPVYIGEIPSHLAALNNLNINVQELVIKAIEEHSKERVFQALLLDPLTSSLLTIPRIRSLWKEMLELEKPYLPELR